MNTFIRTTSDNPEFKKLVFQLDQYLEITDGNEHSFYDQYNKLTNIHHVIVCYSDDKAIGCGALKKYEETKAEIKRMFVLPLYRGKGIGLQLLSQLEQWASELNFSSCILETGKKQTEAISLYQKAGYSIIQNYGPYENVENSICMEKKLQSP